MIVIQARIQADHLDEVIPFFDAYNKQMLETKRRSKPPQWLINLVVHLVALAVALGFHFFIFK